MSDSYVKNSTHFVSIIQNICIDQNEIMVSFDVSSLFTNIPIEEVLKVIEAKLPDLQIEASFSEVIRFVLKSGYFIFDGQFYRQKDGVAMGSPVAPVIAEIWMEHFEKLAIDTSPVKPKIWKRYVDDTFCILKADEVDIFLEHLNSIHSKIRFTIEYEKEETLPFLDVLLKRKDNGHLGHTVYRKTTHTNRYLNGKSHHHPSSFTSVVASLVNRAFSICDKDHLNNELTHIDRVLETITQVNNENGGKSKE